MSSSNSISEMRCTLFSEYTKKQILWRNSNHAKFLTVTCVLVDTGNGLIQMWSLRYSRSVFGLKHAGDEVLAYGVVVVNVTKCTSVATKHKIPGAEWPKTFFRETHVESSPPRCSTASWCFTCIATLVSVPPPATLIDWFTFNGSSCVLAACQPISHSPYSPTASRHTRPHSASSCATACMCTCVCTRLPVHMSAVITPEWEVIVLWPLKSKTSWVMSTLIRISTM